MKLGLVLVRFLHDAFQNGNKSSIFFGNVKILSQVNLTDERKEINL